MYCHWPEVSYAYCMTSVQCILNPVPAIAADIVNSIWANTSNEQWSLLMDYPFDHPIAQLQLGYCCCRIMIDEQAYLEDPEGVGYARAINKYLPPDIRVFCVQVRHTVVEDAVLEFKFCHNTCLADDQKAFNLKAQGASAVVLVIRQYCIAALP